MRESIVFFGTPEYAVPFLKALVSDGKAPIVVVSQPDRPVGRKAVIQPTPVKTAALELKIKIAQPESVNDEQFLANLTQLKPDLFVVVAFGQILSRALLDIPRLGTINVHPSLLPNFRGATPLQEAILSGDTKTGVTIMSMDEKMDHGPILAQEAVELSDDETLSTLEQKTTGVGTSLLLETIEKIRTGTSHQTEQDHSAATFTRELTRDSGKLDFSKTAIELERAVRSLNPWPGTWFSWRTKRVKLLVARASDALGLSGDFFVDQNGSLHAGCSGGSLEVTLLQIEGKKPLSATEFINGYLKG